MPWNVCVCVTSEKCACVSKAVCPGPVLAEAPSNKRNCYIQDTPKQRMCCPQQRAWGRSVPPTHWGGCTCKTHTYNWLTIPLRNTCAQKLPVHNLNAIASSLIILMAQGFVYNKRKFQRKVAQSILGYIHPHWDTGTGALWYQQGSIINKAFIIKRCLCLCSAAHVRGLVAFCLLLDELSFWVDGK